MVCTFHLFKQNCLRVVVECATKKHSVFVTVLVLGVSTPQFFILAAYRIFVYSNLFVLIGNRMNWIVLSQFFRFHSKPVVSVIGRTTTDIANIEIVK